MTKPTPEQRAKEIAEDFMDEEFADEQTAMRWLTERIAVAIEEAERAGHLAGHEAGQQVGFLLAGRKR